MKLSLLAVATILLLASCKTSKDYLSQSKEDNDLFAIVKTIKKHRKDDTVTKDLPNVYLQAQQNHLKKIEEYKICEAVSCWDKIIEEYTALQNIYFAINNSGKASTLVTPVNYQNEINVTQQLAAEDYYQQAIALTKSGGWNDAKRAYWYFKKSDSLVPGYKHVKLNIDKVYQNVAINVLINPLADNLFYQGKKLNNTGYNYAEDYFKLALAKDLSNKNRQHYPVKFYTNSNEKLNDLQPDWVIDIAINNIDTPTAQTNYESRNISQSLQSGTDSMGRPTYITSKSTVNTTTTTYTARCGIKVIISDINTEKIISDTTYNYNYKWVENSSDYSGNYTDRAAVYTLENKSAVVDLLCKKIYPQVKQQIKYAAAW